MRSLSRAAVVVAAALGLLTGPALAAAAATTPTISGVVAGPHTVILDAGQTAVVGEMLNPKVQYYTADVPVTAVVTLPDGQEQITTGWTFLPLNYLGKELAFTVVSVPAGNGNRR